MKIIIAISMAVLLIVLASPQVYAQAEKNVCAVYFTYVGCPHCAKTDPVILHDLLERYPDLVVIEYEFVLEPDNSYVLYDYNSVYNCGTGVPLMIFSKERNIAGDTPILQAVEGMIGAGPNGCPLLNGTVTFKDLDITKLPKKPKIWTKDRILIKSGEGGDNGLLKELLTTEDISAALEGVEFEATEPEEVLLSGVRFPQLQVRGSVKFEHAIRLDGWTFQWNGEGIQGNNNVPNNNGNNNPVNDGPSNNNSPQLPVYVSLAAIALVIFVLFLLIYIAKFR